MFGYIRPLKPDLLVREWTRYRSVYCGLCKQIGRDYGQLPRLAVSYDLTMLAVLLLSLDEAEPHEHLEGCILNPLLKKPVNLGNPSLEACAALTVLLAWHSAADKVRDEASWRGAAAREVLRAARRRAARRFPEYEQAIASHLDKLARLEAGPPDLAAAAVFAAMLKDVFRLTASLVTADRGVQDALGLLGRELGAWVYLLDAIDDLPGDCNNGSWNPFSQYEAGRARQEAECLLAERELACDRTAALLPYRRDAGLLANIITRGLPAVRGKILRGETLGKL
jgi:hypothetical protein